MLRPVVTKERKKRKPRADEMSPETFQEIVKRHILEDIEIKDLAKEYGITPGGLRTKFSRAGIASNRSCMTFNKSSAYWRYKENNKIKKHGQPKNSHLKKVQHMKWVYGLSEQDVRDMMDKQKGCCEICKESLVTTGGDYRCDTYNIDHNHTTGKVRGLLCCKCNKAIGLLQDSPEHLQSAIEYLKKHKEN